MRNTESFLHLRSSELKRACGHHSATNYILFCEQCGSCLCVLSRSTTRYCSQLGPWKGSPAVGCALWITSPTQHLHMDGINVLAKQQDILPVRAQKSKSRGPQRRSNKTWRKCEGDIHPPPLSKAHYSQYYYKIKWRAVCSISDG